MRQEMLLAGEFIFVRLQKSQLENLFTNKNSEMRFTKFSDISCREMADIKDSRWRTSTPFTPSSFSCSDFPSAPSLIALCQPTMEMGRKPSDLVIVNRQKT